MVSTKSPRAVTVAAARRMAKGAALLANPNAQVSPRPFALERRVPLTQSPKKAMFWMEQDTYLSGILTDALYLNEISNDISFKYSVSVTAGTPSECNIKDITFRGGAGSHRRTRSIFFLLLPTTTMLLTYSKCRSFPARLRAGKDSGATGCTGRKW